MKRARLPDGTFVWCDAPLGVRAVWDEVRSYFPDGQAPRAGEVVFDVGANIGLFSLAAWCRSAGQAQIFSFEPMPSTCAICEANARLFDPGETRWHTLRVALGARAELATFHHFPRLSVLSGRVRDHARAVQEMNLALSKPVPDPPLEMFRVFPVPTRRLGAALAQRFLLRTEPVHVGVWTLSSALQKLRVSRVDWLKVDVEGAEFDVLRGVEERDWPLIQRVVLEAETRAQERAARAVLEKVGFKVHTRENSVFGGQELMMLWARRP